MNGVQSKDDFELLFKLNNLQAQGRNNDAAYVPGPIARIVLRKACPTAGQNSCDQVTAGLVAWHRDSDPKPVKSSRQD